MKKLLILTFFAILTCSLLITTFGIFESKVSNDTKIKTAAWKIQINDSIVTNEEKTFSINDVTWSTSNNVLEGKVAPGIEGYFDILIEPNETEVSIKYDLIYDMEYLKNINSAFTITKVEELSGNNLTLTDKNIYTGIISLNDIKDGKYHIIRTHVKWEDLDDNFQNDYKTGTTEANFEIPINVVVSQYLGEEIIKYNEE